MQIRKLIYLIIGVFVTGVLLLTGLQYVTGNKLREVIDGNELVLKEYRLSSELSRLQKDLLILDADIKLAVATGDSGKMADFRSAEKRIGEDLGAMRRDWRAETSIPLQDLNKLENLVGRKIAASDELVKQYYQSGRPFADTANIGGKARRLSDDIIALSRKIDNTGRALLAEKIAVLDRSGQDVLKWQLYIGVLTLILLTAVFLIVIIRMDNQAGLIRLLNTNERKLKEAAMVKESFLANMSHEIRTPLNAILGYTHLLREEKLSGNAGLYLTTVQQSGETLLSIVNDILDISKIESGMMRIERVPFSLGDLVRAVTTMFRHRMEEKGLDFHVHLSASISDTLIGDPTRLTQILVNVIGNAVKFSEKGSITLEINEKRIGVAEIAIEFAVKDTGIGIEKDKMETIFERFSQAEDSTTRKFGGTGLGLSIVRDLVYLQNGEIEIQSESGKGTTLTFSIPYEIGVTADQAIVQPIAETQAFFDPKTKLLVVEDNPINQGLMEKLLENLGLKCRIASNGQEAIAAVNETRFDLIFMDIQMPEMDGYTATTEIRQKLRISTPIIAMTAHAMAGEKEKCIALGMNDHLAKPIRPDALRQILTVFLKKAFDEKSKAIESSDKIFTVINLDYMREISGGDSGYEKLVTEQFLALAPQQIEMLAIAYEHADLPQIQKTAHNLKTTISIMGIEPLVTEDLDALENIEGADAQVKPRIERIATICQTAIAEAQTFYASF